MSEAPPPAKRSKRSGTPKGGQADPDSYDVPLEDAFLTSHLPFKLKPSVFAPENGKKSYWKRLRQILAAEEWPADGGPSYVTIEAPPSVYPPRRYCDLTGEAAKYSDPKTGLRYATAQQYAVIRSLPDEVVQAHLAVRNASVIIK